MKCPFCNKSKISNFSFDENMISGGFSQGIAEMTGSGY